MRRAELGIQQFGRPTIELREFAHLQDIGLDGFGRAIAQLQIFNETLPQRSHESISAKVETPARGNQLRQVWNTIGEGANRYNRYNRTWRETMAVMADKNDPRPCARRK
jgi:hypothetical protein